MNFSTQNIKPVEINIQLRAPQLTSEIKNLQFLIAS